MMLNATNLKVVHATLGRSVTGMCLCTIRINYFYPIFGHTEVCPNHSSLCREKIGEITWNVYKYYQEKLIIYPMLATLRCVQPILPLVGSIQEKILGTVCVPTLQGEINYLSYFGHTEVCPNHSSLGREKIGEITQNVYMYILPGEVNYLSYVGHTEVCPNHSSLGRKKIGEITWYVYLHYQQRLIIYLILATLRCVQINLPWVGRRQEKLLGMCTYNTRTN